MKSRINTKSLFGSVPYIFSKKTSRWNINSLKDKKEFLHVDDKDGHLALYTLCFKLNATVYETNKNFLYGGKEDVPTNIPNTEEYIYINQMIKGLEDRAKLNFIESKLNIYNKNFYECNDNNKFIYVTACRSLDRESNKHIPMNIKINKLKQCVDEGGYLYIEYLIAIDENDYQKYPSNSYFRKDEILNHFDSEEWLVLSNEVKIINDELTPLNRTQEEKIVGYLDVRRKKERTQKNKKRIQRKRKEANISNKYKLQREKTKEFTISNEQKYRHNYIINGVLR